MSPSPLTCTCQTARRYRRIMLPRPKSPAQLPRSARIQSSHIKIHQKSVIRPRSSAALLANQMMALMLNVRCCCVFERVSGHMIVSMLCFCPLAEVSSSTKLNESVSPVTFSVMSWLIASAPAASQRHVLTLLANEAKRDCLLSIISVFCLCLMCKYFITTNKLIVL